MCMHVFVFVPPILGGSGCPCNLPIGSFKGPPMRLSSHLGRPLRMININDTGEPTVGDNNVLAPQGK